jgi:Predicted ATP-dependent protease
LTTNKLAWRDLVPDTESYQELFAQPELAKTTDTLFSDVQARLHYGFEQLLHPLAVSPFMLVKAPEEIEYLQLFAEQAQQLRQPEDALYGVNYQIDGASVTCHPARSASDNFASTGNTLHADWVESEQLIGCVRQFNGSITLQPGLVHQANGGVLVLSLRALLAQPLLWLRLKTIVSQQRFDWLSMDESRPLPIAVPSMPLQTQSDSGWRS